MLNQDPNSKCGILYIDDEEKALKYFKMAFSAKFEVFTASSGKAGLELLRKESARIGIIISDQKMPEMQGAEVLSVAREEFPRIVRILTTAYSDLDSAIQAVNKGHIYQYIVKPWEIQDLGMILQRAADYFQVLSERNELLSLKMTTMQRIVCSDRVKWLLLAGREEKPFRQALAALVNALPATASPLPAEKGSYTSRDFDISALLQREYKNASHILDLLKAPSSGATAQIDELVKILGLKASAVSIIGNEITIEMAAIPAETIFGVLVEGEISESAAVFFKTLLVLAAEGSSLKVQAQAEGEAPMVYEFPLAESIPDAPEKVIESLYEKFSSWDIAKLQ